MFIPAYQTLSDSGELEKRADKLYSLISECSLCPRECKAKRLEGDLGVCGAGAKAQIASVFPHFGEEPPLVGRNGSGTLFFTHCNLRCDFCQNYEISHIGEGAAVSTEKLASYLMYLQNMGCHNVNFVTPTHFAPQIVASLSLAARLGLRIPVVWNCGGYESIEVIKLLEGIVDIYMPDIKYSDEDAAKKYSQAPNYFKVAQDVVKEMHRQVGDLELDYSGIALKGLLVRHLVMPNDAAGSEDIFRFIADEISRNTYINIMDQYRPAFNAHKHDPIARPITSREFSDAVACAKSYGLNRGI